MHYFLHEIKYFYVVVLKSTLDPANEFLPNIHIKRAR